LSTAVMRRAAVVATALADRLFVYAYVANRGGDETFAQLNIPF